MDLKVPESESCTQGYAALVGRAQAVKALSYPPVRAVKSGLHLGHRCGRAGLSCVKPRMAGYPLGKPAWHPRLPVRSRLLGSRIPFRVNREVCFVAARVACSELESGSGIQPCRPLVSRWWSNEVRLNWSMRFVLSLFEIPYSGGITGVGLFNF